MSMDQKISSPAELLNDAVIDRDIKMCRSIIKASSGKHGAASLVLEAVCHIERTADEVDWFWLANTLISP